MAISPGQCRAARALLGWSQDDLAREGAVAKATVAVFEAGKRTPYDRTLIDIQAAFERAGVTFDLNGGAGVGVRFVAAAPMPPALRHSEPAGPATDVLKRMEADIHEDRERPKRKPSTK